MKLYKFNLDRTVEIPATKTIVSFIRAMIKLHKNGQESFTALEVINYALHHGLWSTTQLTDEKRMTTWAFYVKKLKALGLEECGETGSSNKKVLTIADLLEEFEEDTREIPFEAVNDDAERELEDEDMEKSCDEDEELERMLKEEAALQAAE